jgi:hypothetical protein
MDIVNFWRILTYGCISQLLSLELQLYFALVLRGEFEGIVKAIQVGHRWKGWVSKFLTDRNMAKSAPLDDNHLDCNVDHMSRASA